MSVLVMVLLIGTILATIALLAAMFVQDKPFYGAIATLFLVGPGSVLAFLYYSLAQG